MIRVASISTVVVTMMALVVKGGIVGEINDTTNQGQAQQEQAKDRNLDLLPQAMEAKMAEARAEIKEDVREAEIGALGEIVALPHTVNMTTAQKNGTKMTKIDVKMLPPKEQELKPLVDAISLWKVTKNTIITEFVRQKIFRNLVTIKAPVAINSKHPPKDAIEVCPAKGIRKNPSISSSNSSKSLRKEETALGLRKIIDVKMNISPRKGTSSQSQIMTKFILRAKVAARKVPHRSKSLVTKIISLLHIKRRAIDQVADVATSHLKTATAVNSAINPRIRKMNLPIPKLQIKVVDVATTLAALRTTIRRTITKMAEIRIKTRTSLVVADETTRRMKRITKAKIMPHSPRVVTN